MISLGLASYGLCHLRRLPVHDSVSFCAFWFVMLFWPILGPFWCLVVTLVTFSTNLHIFFIKIIPHQKKFNNNQQVKKKRKINAQIIIKLNLLMFWFVFVCFAYLLIIYGCISRRVPCYNRFQYIA